MYQDGVCRVKPGYFTKTIQFQDINYQLNQNEDKTAIFEGWCDFLNYFDSSVKFQLSFMNMAANKDTYGQNIVIAPQGDDFDNIRTEYTNMLRSQLARGNNGLIKTKYLTFGIEAANIKAAKPRLDRDGFAQQFQTARCVGRIPERETASGSDAQYVPHRRAYRFQL